MKEFYKKPINIVILIVMFFGGLFLIKELPKEDNMFKKAYVWFRFNLYPRGYYYRDYYYRDYYYRDYYTYRYVRVELSVENQFNKHVSDVRVNGIVVMEDSYDNYPRTKYFSLRPGYHTISWKTNSKFWPGYKTFQKNFKVYREDDFINIMIKGDRIYID